MNTFLIDVNLSPETENLLRENFGYDVLRSTPPELPDEEIVRFAQKEKRIIITQDLDFGEIYYLRERGNLGVIVLRLRDRTVESVNARLATFFSLEANDINLATSLVIISENKIRVIQG